MEENTAPRGAFGKKKKIEQILAHMEATEDGIESISSPENRHTLAD